MTARRSRSCTRNQSRARSNAAHRSEDERFRLRRRRPTTTVVAWFAWFAWLATIALPLQSAQEKKIPADEKKPEPARILLTLPLAISAGTTNAVQLRGLHLTTVTELRVTNLVTEFTSVISTSGPVEVPKDFTAKKIGDTQLRITIAPPSHDALATNWLVAVNPAGKSEPFPLLVLPDALATLEVEPNGGFQQAQTIPPGRYVLGTIQESGDVDVFRVAVRAGQVLAVELYAAPGGSTLDSLVSILDATGNLLAANDDAQDTRDSRVAVRAPHDGALSVVVQDANDTGGLTHLYVLRAVAR